MKRLAAVALLAALALGSACAASTKVDSTSETTTPTTVVVESGPSRSECIAMTSHWANLMEQYRSVVGGITYATPALVAKVIETGREAVAAGRRIVSQCGHYAPAEAAQYASSLDAVERSLNAAEGLQTS